ncbi:MAG: hypothetical protein M1834_003890 [Cirrosporium novae-zelandiae]|nr:MAG: hypothetical protein M1834_003890 [Cirrosporium novae-zelandiae]
MFQFRGDSYRPADRGSDPGRHDPMNFSFRGDDRAPRYPQGDTYRPPTFASNNSHSEPHSNTRPRPRDGKHFRPNRRPFRQHEVTSERPLLTARQDVTPERVLGVDVEHPDAVKFLDLEDVSDSEEEDMQLESDDGNGDIALATTEVQSCSETGDDEEPPKKKVTKESIRTRHDGSEIPKWSNPDPYTVLPPVDETHKKKDIVKLIRKARITSEGDKVEVSNAVTANDDFISFDFGDDDGSMAIENEVPLPPKNSLPPLPQGLPTKSSFASIDRDAKYNGAPGATSIAIEASSQSKIVVNGDPALGNRKRTHDDTIKFLTTEKTVYQIGHLNTRGAYRHDVGEIVSDWQPAPGQNPTPWYCPDPDHEAKVSNPAYSLHREICDFYSWCRPQDWERAVRTDLIDRIQNTLSRHHLYTKHKIFAFGSFASGLYLPVADMDLVLLSPKFQTTGYDTSYGPRKVRDFANFLRSNHIASDIQTIPKARVPIVKFIDKVTGLKVDVSFDNSSGLVANQTFAMWKEMYPAMPVLVSIIKQFLLMRRFDDVSTGGLGGFSIICLIVSLMQQLPSIQRGELDPVNHLGEILMEFLDLYGNNFDTTRVGIQMNPPAYFVKGKNTNLPYRAANLERLSIVDPNDPYNDVSGGSKNILLILEAFGTAFKTLQGAMYAGNPHKSILGAILGGDYSSYYAQREMLRGVAEGLKILDGSQDLPQNILGASSSSQIFNLPGHNDISNGPPIPKQQSKRALIKQTKAEREQRKQNRKNRKKAKQNRTTDGKVPANGNTTPKSKKKGKKKTYAASTTSATTTKA